MMGSRAILSSVWVVVTALLSGCGTVYLYDKERDRTGQEVVASFEKAEFGALFDRAAEDVNDHLVSQQASVKRLAAAAQDLQLVALISGQEDPAQLQAGTGTGAGKAGARLVWLAKNRLDRIVGKSAADKLVKRKDLEALRTIQLHAEVRANSIAQEVNNWRRSYKGEGGNSKNTCEEPVKEPMAATAPPADPTDAQAAYDQLVMACANWAKVIKAAELGVGSLIPVSTLDKTQDFAKVTEKHKQLREAKSDLADLKKALKKRTDDLQDDYDKALQAAKQNPKAAQAKQDLKEAADKVKEFFKDLQNIQEEGDDFAQKANDAARQAGLSIDLGVIEDLTGVSVDYIGQLLSAEILGTNLNALLDVATDPENTPKDEEGKRAQTYYLMTIRAIDTLARLDDAVNAPEKVPAPNALIIGLAYQRYLQENAKVTEAKINGEIAAASAQEQALVEEIYHLWSAYGNAKAMDGPACGKSATGFAQYVDMCAKKNPNAVNAAAKALRHYDRAWTHGLIVTTTAGVAGLGLHQQYAVEKARQSARAWFDILRPAVEELAAYGAGGIKQETISNLVNALGLSAISVGVN